MNATKERISGLASFGRDCVTYKHTDSPKYSKDILGMVKVLIGLRAEMKITDEQFTAALKYIFSNYVENKITEKIYYALDKTLLKHSLS